MKRVLKITSYLVLISVVIFMQFSCASGKTTIYSERSINPSDVPITKVAILPNRLPLNLTNSEYWRKYNFEVIQDAFSEKGYQVLDYNTSDHLFRESGLPMSDTKISRDKYAELGEKLGVDILVFPYYGQLYELTSLGIFQITKYKSIGSLQFYSTKHNDFISRVDFEGKTSVFAPIAVPLLGYLLPLMISPPTKSYRKAYRVALNKSVKEFLQKYNTKTNRMGTSNNTNNSVVKPEINTTNTKSNYSKFSIKELEELKKEALATEDFKKAGEIKKEIDAKKAKVENSKYGKYSINELKTMKEEAVKNGDYKKAGEIKKEIENR